MGENEPENQYTPTVVVTLGFDISVCEEEYGQNNNDNVPSGEYQSIASVSIESVSRTAKTYVKVSATEPILSGAYHAENATMAGICSKQTCKAYADPISMLV